MPDTVVLRAAGVGLVLAFSGRGLPRVAHWGADPGALDPGEAGVLAGGVSAAAAQVGGADPYAIPLLPAQWDGWVGRPGATGERAGRWQHLRLALTGSHFHYGNHVEYESADPDAGVTVDTRLVLDRHGVVRLRHALTNDGPDTWTVAALRCLLPVPDRAAELFDLTGRWALERLPQRMPFAYGTHARDSRRGRTGHDAPTLLVAGTPGFGDGHGEVWSVHTGWSGDTEHYAERINGATAVIGGAELLAPGEIRLGPGETYETPEVWFVWSDQGLDGLSDRLHRTIRARPGHPRTPRPLTLNVWEAVYFDHDLDRLRALADRAAEIGVERYVLDDGWFRGRRDDTAGLGDWEVDPAVWPDGLHPLVDHVRARGCGSGCGSSRRWSTRTRISPARTRTGCSPPPAARPGRSGGQQVLDLARPEVADLLFARIDALVTEYGIDYIKWDHNRDRPGGRGRRAPPDGGRLRAAGPAARGAPRPRDRVVRVRRRTGRPRHPRPHRPGVGVGQQRPRRPAGDPARHGAAAPAGAGRQPRRPEPGAHHRPGRRPRIPLRHRAGRARRHRVGHHPLHARGARDPDRLDPALPPGARPAAHRPVRPQ